MNVVTIGAGLLFVLGSSADPQPTLAIRIGVGGTFILGGLLFTFTFGKRMFYTFELFSSYIAIKLFGKTSEFHFNEITRLELQ